jgi:rhodanese-related sulfurtransferase
MEVKRGMATSLMEMLQEARKNVRELAVQEAAKNLAGRDVLLVDVREASEFDRGHIPGAVNIPRGILEIKADPGSPGADPELVGQRDASVLLYCLRAPSARSILAAQTLLAMGYSNVAALEGGLLSWRDQGLPVESASAKAPPGNVKGTGEERRPASVAVK